ncbi:SAF domain-containing protein [Mycolicibacterium thermoresistibile]
MRESLNPSAWSRLTELRPDWTRTLAARRIAAAALVMLAAVAALRSDPQGERTEVVIAARDLAPGVALGTDDVRLERHLAAGVPDGATTDLGAVIGTRLAGPVRRGEALTDVRLLSPRLAEAAAGPGARIVPLHLSDIALTDLIRVGDVVDVLGAAPGAAPGGQHRPQLLATEAVVVLVSEQPRTGGDRVVLVAVPAHTANDVAAAALMHDVTITFH